MLSIRLGNDDHGGSDHQHESSRTYSDHFVLSRSCEQFAVWAKAYLGVSAEGGTIEAKRVMSLRHGGDPARAPLPRAPPPPRTPVLPPLSFFFSPLLLSFPLLSSLHQPINPRNSLTHPNQTFNRTRTHTLRLTHTPPPFPKQPQSWQEKHNRTGTRTCSISSGRQ